MNHSTLQKRMLRTAGSPFAVSCPCKLYRRGTRTGARPCSVVSGAALSRDHTGDDGSSQHYAKKSGGAPTDAREVASLTLYPSPQAYPTVTPTLPVP